MGVVVFLLVALNPSQAPGFYVVERHPTREACMETRSQLMTTHPVDSPNRLKCIRSTIYVPK